eukprot:7672663-Lingulodinium_polyedra.AAC.1
MPRAGFAGCRERRPRSRLCVFAGVPRGSSSGPLGGPAQPRPHARTIIRESRVTIRRNGASSKRRQ